MFYRREKSEFGAYCATDGTRVELFSASYVTARQRPLWDDFEDDAAAAAAWGLTYDPLPEPEDSSNYDEQFRGDDAAADSANPPAA